MEINMKRIDDAFNLEAINSSGNTARTDGGLAIGGRNSALSPMEMVLAAVGGCSSIDIIMLLNKQRQNLLDLRINIKAQRRVISPRLFTAIHLSYELVGNIDEKKAERACRLSMEKMCSVSLMLKAGGVVITWDYKVTPGAIL